MAIVYVESTLIDMLIYALIGLGIAVVACNVAWGIREYRTPQEAKEIRRGSHKKTPMLLLQSDDGLIEIEPVARRGPEGIGETESRGKLKLHFTGAYPRSTNIPLIPDDSESATRLNGGTPDEKVMRTQAIADYIFKLNTKPSFLKGAKIAFGVAYKGKAIITTIAALAGLKALDDLSQLYPNDMIQRVDVTAIKNHFNNEWNQSQIQANEADKFLAGQVAASKNRDLKWWILPVLTLALILIGLAGLIAVLKFI